MSRPASERPRVLTVASHLGVMAIVSVVLGVVVSGLAIPFAGLLGVAAQSTSDTLDDLPQDLEASALPQKTEILDSTGNVIATVYDQNRVNVSLDQISRTMVKAIVSIEDYRFYQHGALDVKGTLRAFVTNQAASGVVQGGSSITQQLVKLTLLQNAKTKKEQADVIDDTYARKLRELRYAIALEKRHSKDWILERYLNIAYFGDGAYGVQAAAKHYFDVNARNLDLNQSAILAGLVQNPTSFDPTNHPDRTVARRDVVIDRMAQLSVISQQRADKVKKAGLGLDPQPAENGCLNSSAPFFCDYVISYLKEDPSLGKNREERERTIYSGGLTINTTIDLRYQRAANRSVRSHVYRNNDAIGALAMVEPGTGEVRAIAQSRPMGRDKDDGYTFLNYVVPEEYGDSGGFQAGSTFKPFVLAAAVEDGIPLDTQINSPSGIPLAENEFKTCNGYYASSGVWTPNNSTGDGTFDLYTGTQNSVNTFYAQLEKRIGICKPFRLAENLGVRVQRPTATTSGDMVPSFTLGVSYVSPLEMAEAYATFAARGLHCDARPVTSIEDANGRTLKEYRPSCSQEMPSAVADAVNDVLKGVQDPGGFGYNAGISLNDRDDAGKTGTTTDNKSVWFVGYTPNMATAAMVAGANKEGTPVSLTGQTIGPSFVYSAAGSTTAGPLWGDAMKAIEPFLEVESFTPPSTTEIAGVVAEVPDVSGMSLDDALAALEDAGFTGEIGSYVDSSVPEGLVAFTGPSAGTSLSNADPVYVYQSDGTPPRERNRNRGNRGRGRG